MGSEETVHSTRDMHKIREEDDRSRGYSRNDSIMTRCKQGAHLLPTRFFDMFLPIGSNFFAPLHFPHSCRILPHSSATTSDHRQAVLNVFWPKN